MGSTVRTVVSFHISLPTGIGRATAKALAKYGGEVIALSRTQADLDSLKEEVQTCCSKWQFESYMCNYFR